MKTLTFLQLENIIPYRQDIQQKNWFQEIRMIIVNIFILFAFVVILNNIIHFIIKSFSIIDPKTYYNNKMIEIQNYFGPVLKWFIIGGLGPILEELAFRLGLTFKRKSICLSLTICLFFIITPNPYLIGFTFANIMKIVVLIGVYFLLTKKTSDDFWLNMKQGHGKSIIYLFVIIFAILHIQNFVPLSWMQVPYYIIYLGPFFIMSLAFSFLRLRYGILFSIATHMLWNTMLLVHMSH